jgi:hypothetical protein
MKNITTWLMRLLVALIATVTALTAAAATAQAATPTTVRPATTLSICANSPIPSGYVIPVLQRLRAVHHPDADGRRHHGLRQLAHPHGLRHHRGQHQRRHLRRVPGLLHPHTRGQRHHSLWQLPHPHGLRHHQDQHRRRHLRRLRRVLHRPGLVLGAESAVRSSVAPQKADGLLGCHAQCCRDRTYAVGLRPCRAAPPHRVDDGAGLPKHRPHTGL